MSRVFGQAGALGAGSFGRVTRVVDVHSGAAYAAKIFERDDEGLISPETWVELAFLRAVQGGPALIALECVVCDLDGEPSAPTAILPLCAGNLEAALAWLPSKSRAGVVHGVLAAVAWLHHHRPWCILHRDIKPANVLLTADQAPLLCDFSLAVWHPCPTTRLTGFAANDGVLGTTGYISPEVLAGLPGCHAPPLDVWAAGVTCLETLTGAPLLAARDKGAVREVEARRAELGPGPWPRVVASCLAPLPAGRLSAAAALAQVSALLGRPVEVPTPGPTTQGRRAAEARAAAAEAWAALALQDRQRLSRAAQALTAPDFVEKIAAALLQLVPGAAPLTALLVAIKATGTPVDEDEAEEAATAGGFVLDPVETRRVQELQILLASEYDVLRVVPP